MEKTESSKKLKKTSLLKMKTIQEVIEEEEKFKREQQLIRKLEDMHPLKKVFQKTYQHAKLFNKENFFEKNNETESSENDTIKESRMIITRIRSRLHNRQASMPNFFQSVNEMNKKREALSTVPLEDQNNQQSTIPSLKSIRKGAVQTHRNIAS